MKKTSKFLAVALAVFMLMMTSVTAFADAESYWLETGETYDVYVPGGSYDFFGFEAEESGCYVIDTFITEYDEAADPCIEVYDDYGNQVAYNDDYYGFESAVVFYAEEGEYYTVYCYDASNTEDTYYQIVINGGCADLSQDGYCDSCRETSFAITTATRAVSQASSGRSQTFSTNFSELTNIVNAAHITGKLKIANNFIMSDNA